MAITKAFKMSQGGLGSEILIDADGDTTITADTDDQIDVKIANTDHLILKGSSGDVVFQAAVDAKDIKFNQYDGRTLLDINDGGWVGIHNGATAAGQLRLYEDTDNGTNFTAFQVGTQSGDVTYTLPTADGSNGQNLTTNGSGVLSWASASGGGGLAVESAVNNYDSSSYYSTFSYAGFDNDYDNYLVLIHAISLQSDGDIEFQWLDDGSPITGGGYRVALNGIDSNGTDRALNSNNEADPRIFDDLKSGDDRPFSGFMYMQLGRGGRWDSDSSDSEGNVRPMVTCDFVGKDHSNYVRLVHGGWFYDDAAGNTMNGFHLLFQAGSGAVKVCLTVYGIVRS